MTDSVQCNKYLSARMLQNHLGQIFSFTQMHIRVFLLTVKQLILHTAAFFLTAPQVSESQPCFVPFQPHVLLIKLQFCIFHVHQRHRQTGIVHVQPG